MVVIRFLGRAPDPTVPLRKDRRARPRYASGCRRRTFPAPSARPLPGRCTSQTNASVAATNTGSAAVRYCPAPHFGADGCLELFGLPPDGGTTRCRLTRARRTDRTDYPSAPLLLLVARHVLVALIPTRRRWRHRRRR